MVTPSTEVYAFVIWFDEVEVLPMAKSYIRVPLSNDLSKHEMVDELTTIPQPKYHIPT